MGLSMNPGRRPSLVAKLVAIGHDPGRPPATLDDESMQVRPSTLVRHLSTWSPMPYKEGAGPTKFRPEDLGGAIPGAITHERVRTTTDSHGGLALLIGPLRTGANSFHQL